LPKLLGDSLKLRAKLGRGDVLLVELALKWPVPSWPNTARYQHNKARRWFLRQP